MKTYLVGSLLIALGVFTFWYGGRNAVVITVPVNTVKYSDTLTLSWHEKRDAVFPPGTGTNLTSSTLQGFETESFPTDLTESIASLTEPFRKYYDEKLTADDWKIEPLLSADGAGSSIWVYSKEDRYFILSYKSAFQNVTDNAPAECPCTITFTSFEGSVQ